MDLNEVGVLGSFRTTAKWWQVQFERAIKQKVLQQRKSGDETEQETVQTEINGR